MAGRVLKRTQFGNPILQIASKQLSVDEIKSGEIQELIADIRYTLSTKKLGVGLAAPQVGASVALSVIDIKVLPHHPNAHPFSQVIINPTLVKGIGDAEEMWEGCLSFGAVGSPVFAKTVRYKKIEVSYYDEKAVLHGKEILEGLPAQVFQHETDHLNGILFPQMVKDHTTWMNASEYRKRIRNKR